jgi:hypothetical protein
MAGSKLPASLLIVRRTLARESAAPRLIFDLARKWNTPSTGTPIA